jgi:DNA polymerase-3 subunit alpha
MDEMVALINEGKRLKINLTLPDINQCQAAFTINDKADKEILFGLAAIKNVGRVAVENIIKERGEKGPYKSFIDFCTRIDARVVNKKTVEALIFAGAFDSLEKNRKKLHDNYEAVIYRHNTKKPVETGQNWLFGAKTQEDLKDVILDPLGDGYPDWSDKEKLSYEKSVLGLYVSAHPLTDYENEINKLATLRFGDVADIETEQVDLSKLQRVRMCGIINDLRVKQSKKGNRFAVFMLEDFTGQGECVVFPRPFEQHIELLRNDNIVSITGRADENGNTVKIIVDEIAPLTKQIPMEVESLTIKIDSGSFTAEKIYRIKELKSKSGSCKVYINLKNGRKESMMELENLKIHYDEYTERILSEIFGKENIILQ